MLIEYVCINMNFHNYNNVTYTYTNVCENYLCTFAAKIIMKGLGVFFNNIVCYIKLLLLKQYALFSIYSMKVGSNDDI